MASDEDSLKALEALMNEFFDIRTSNEQKRRIEQILLNFQQQQGAWKHCLYYLSHTTNEYVMMYCLTALQDLISKQWIGMLGEEKREIRTALYKFLLSQQDRPPPFFIRNKLGKLVVDIGRLDWPHFYPDFFNNILQLTQNSVTTPLGLMLLQTASEELAFPKEDLSVLRKEELHSLLLEQIPSMLSVVGDILQRALEKHRHLVTATPPPSPTHGSEISSGSSSVVLFSTSPSNTSQMLSGLLSSPPGGKLQSLPPLDNESHSVCLQALSCLSHFFSWMPLGAHLTQGLINTVFQFACFGSDPPQAHHHNVTNSAELGIVAMSCINEIMGKNCVPAQFEDFMLQMFQNTFYLLQRLTRDGNHQSAQGSSTILSYLDPNYLERFTDILRLFVSSHLMRLEGNTQFPVLEFLALLFKYTFQQATHSGFCSCLEIWNVFLDCLVGQIKNRQTNQSSILERYKEALVSLLTETMKKIQFKYNQCNLQELDDDYVDDDSETEWQNFLRQCLESVGKISDLMPVEAFTVVLMVFEENCEPYLGTKCFLDTGMKNSACVPTENECNTLLCSLRDLCTSLQTLGSLAHLFLGDSFCHHFDCVHKLLQRVSHMAMYSNRSRLYSFASLPSALINCLTKIHVQVLATLRSFCHWLSQYQGEAICKDQANADYVTLVTNIVEFVSSNIIEEYPESVKLSACHLLLSVTSTVRPHFLFKLIKVQELFSMVTQGCLRTQSLQVQLLTYRCLSNVLLVPWPLVAEKDQEWPLRSNHHQQFIQSLTGPFIQVGSSALLSQQKDLQDQAKPVIKWTLRILQDQVQNQKDYPSRSKQLAFPNLQESVSMIVSLLPIYLAQLDVGEDMLDFFLVLFDVLQAQVGVQFTEQTIHTFLNMFSRDQLAQCILHEGSAGARVVEKFLHLLQHVVQEPGNAFKVFVPNSVDFCLNQIYPVVVENNSPDVKHSLFELFHQILLHNWQYFFKSSILDTLGQPGKEAVHNEEQFTKIMEAFCKSFLQPDINIFKQNLRSLEDLNIKWKLFHKGLFRSRMLNSFLNVFLESLVQRSHDILREEIVQCIFHLACVDMDNFYQEFLNQYLHSCQGIDNNQKNILARNFKLHTDQPTFTQNLYHLVNDLRYYRLCNSSPPPGSVLF